MSLVDHLGELRTRLFRSILAVALGAVVGFAISDQVIAVPDRARSRPTIRSTSLGSATRSSSSSRSRSSSGSSSRCRSSSTSCGRSSSPGLTPAERRPSGRGSRSPSSSSRSASAIAYVVLPYATQFLLSFTDDGPRSRPSRPAPYFDFVTTMFLAFGLVMEFPILLVGLSRVGIVTSERLRASRRMVILGHRDLRGGRDAGRRPRQPVRPRRHDVRPVRADRSCSSGAAGGDRRGRTPRAPARRGDRAGRRRSSPACPAAARRPRPSCSRTSATRSSTTCRASCCPTSPSSSPSDRERFARVAIVLDVRAGDATLALARDARRARGPRHPAAGRLPRGRATRSSSGASARPATATRSRDERGIASSIAEERALLDAVRSEAGRRPRHLGPVAARAARAPLRRSSPPTSGPTSSRSSSSASGSSTACRSRPTSSSTSGSCRTRSTSPSCASCPA